MLKIVSPTILLVFGHFDMRHWGFDTCRHSFVKDWSNRVDTSIEQFIFCRKIFNIAMQKDKVLFEYSLDSEE